MQSTKNKEIYQHNKNERDSRYTKMPYGKYKGFFIKDVPVDYLKWCVLNYSDQAMAMFLAEELVRREPKFKKR
jgi:hypothetical protein